MMTTAKAETQAITAIVVKMAMAVKVVKMAMITKSVIINDRRARHAV